MSIGDIGEGGWPYPSSWSVLKPSGAGRSPGGKRGAAPGSPACPKRLTVLAGVAIASGFRPMNLKPGSNPPVSGGLDSQTWLDPGPRHHDAPV
jgi:hypothetical protein